MSVSSISSNYGHYQAGGGHQRKQEIDALDQALQTGDISSAQQAFSALFSANSNQTDSSSSSSNSTGGDGVIADISALGKALSSGDLTSAQSAFSSLQDDIKNGPPPPPPPQNQSGSSDSTSSSDSVQSLFEQLAEALQSGDLSAAQSAFSSLQAAAPDNQSSDATSSDPFSNDIASLSSALSSGDISSAQTAFAQLQEDLQNAPPPPPGGPNGPGGRNGPDGNGDQVQQAFSDLATALQNNDLDAANTAFATLQSLAPDNQSDSTSSSSSGVTTSASTSSNDTIGTDLSSLSDALQSGDLTSAQSLFQTLLEDLQANAPRHPGVHQYSQNSSDSSDSSTSVSVSA